MVLGRPRSAVPKDDMMPPGLQSTCASSCRGLAGHSLCRERVHGLCCFRGGAQPEHIRECCRESCPIGSARGGCFQAEPGLHKALAQGLAPLALPEVVSRQNLVCRRLWHKVLPHWLCQGRLFPGRPRLVRARLWHKVLPLWLCQGRLFPGRPWSAQGFSTRSCLIGSSREGC